MVLSFVGSIDIKIVHCALPAFPTCYNSHAVRTLSSGLDLLKFQPVGDSVGLPDRRPRHIARSAERGSPTSLRTIRRPSVRCSANNDPRYGFSPGFGPPPHSIAVVYPPAPYPSIPPQRSTGLPHAIHSEVQWQLAFQKTPAQPESSMSLKLWEIERLLSETFGAK
jgi:hypothetical protein